MNNSEELQHFLDVLLKESNFTRAAKELYISQPYLTQLIGRIEKKIGTKIINRDERPYTLTPAGLVYYQYLERVSFEKQQLGSQLEVYTHPDQQVLKIGILESLGTYLLPEILPLFLKENPSVKVQLFEKLPQENEKSLLNGELDCYIGQTPAVLDASLDVVTSNPEQYYVVIPSTSPSYQAGRFILNFDELDLQKVLQEPLVLCSPESAIRHQVNGLFQNLDLKENIALETKSMITATNLAIHGVGITIAPASVIKRMEQLPLNLLPLEQELMGVSCFIATRSEEKSPTLKNLITIFQKVHLPAKIR